MHVVPFAALRANGFVWIDSCRTLRCRSGRTGSGVMTYDVSLSAQALATYVGHVIRILCDAGMLLDTPSPSVRPERSEGFDACRTLRWALGEWFRVV